MIPLSSSFLTRSLTEGADSPTWSPSLTSGIRPCSCKRLIICRSMASRSGASPPNFIRLSSSGDVEDNMEIDFCQVFIRRLLNKTLVYENRGTPLRRTLGRKGRLPFTQTAICAGKRDRSGAKGEQTKIINAEMH